MSRRRQFDKSEVKEEPYHPEPTPTIKRSRPLEPLNDRQAEYMGAIKSNILTFGTGPAGTGKTFIATSLAAEELVKRNIKKILLTRPAQECGEKLGYLPGELHEKYEPYLRPFKDILNVKLGPSAVDCMVKNGKIEALPMSYMRGMTFSDCWVLLDEAQNCTPVQMKMFLTRIGERCKVIINGDLSQQDIIGESGLSHALHIARDLPDVAEVRFTRDDIVRSGLVQMLVDRYSEEEPMQGVRRFLG